MAEGARRGRDGARARAEALGARRTCRRRRAWARHAARDHRGGDQGADARRQAHRSALRGSRAARAQAERCRNILAELAGGGEQPDLIVSRLTLSHLIEEVGGAAPPDRRTDRGKDRAGRRKDAASSEPVTSAIRACSTASAISSRTPSTSPRARSRSRRAGRRTR